MNKLDATKQISKFIVGGSVSFTVANAIRNNVLPATKIQKIEIFVASAVVGWMVADKAEDFTDEKIDELVAWYKNIKQELK